MREKVYLLHTLPVLCRLQVLHKNLRSSEVFLAESAGGDNNSTGKLGTDRRQHHSNVKFHLHETHPPATQEMDYFVLLCAPVLREAAGEVGVTGGAPVFHVILLLSRKKRSKI